MEKEMLTENEVQANRIVAGVMRITFLIFTLIYLLNVCGVFIVNKILMTQAYVFSAILLLLPTVLICAGQTEKKYVKYIDVMASVLFVWVLCVTLTYHVVVIYAYPIAIASLYFSRKLNVISAILTVLAVSVGQYIAYHLDTLQDDNFTDYYYMLVYGILPRALILVAIAAIFTMLCERTKQLLNKLIGAVHELSRYHEEMVMGFAILVENKDGSTGGHIKRTSMYVKLLAEELMRLNYSSDILDKTYADNLCKAAPMHDIGKISVPDVILQKPGKLTDDEYATMKLHAERGGEIIRETFGHLQDKEYTQMAYEVARFHHEKWNGKGYPEGLRAEDIPLGARIMAIADVFDAISMKRCYRDAMPLEQCFDIIQNGKGTDFDPVIVDAFFNIRDKIEIAYRELQSGENRRLYD